MEELTSKLHSILYENGAALVGCADLSQITDSILRYGVAVAIPIEPHIIKGIVDGPTEEYFKAYHRLEETLNQIVLKGEEFLISHGYRAYAQTSQRIEEDADWCTEFPHKTIATNAGIGWIGKSCLLVTEEYGSAIRLSSILTDAPIVCGKPIRESKCKGCKKCTEACPANALSGVLWSVGIDREDMLDKEACAKKQVELTRKNTGIESEFLCGKCFAVCPFTQRYIERCGKKS